MSDPKVTRPRRVYVGTEGDGPAYCDCGKKDIEDVCHEDPREPCRATARIRERRVRHARVTEIHGGTLLYRHEHGGALHLDKRKAQRRQA